MLNNIHLNPFAISNLLIVLTCFPLCFVILLYGRTKISRIYCLQVLTVGMWGLSGFFASTTRSPEVSLVWWKISCAIVTFIPIFFLHAVSLLIENKNKVIVFLSYFQGLFFLFFIKSNPLFLHEAKFMFNSFFYAQGNKLFLFYLIVWLLVAFFSNFLIIKFYFERKYKEYLLLLFAALCGFTGGAMNFLPVLNFHIYPIGNFLLPIYTVIMAYAILKYQIFEINVVIQKSFVYSSLVTLITATYLIFVFSAERLFQGMVGYTSLVVSILYAFVIALFFTPVKNRIQHLADKIFLGKDPIQIAKENELMKQELERAERLKAVAHFASGMAHEIKNPLTAIKTFAEYLPEKKNDPEFLNKFSKIVSGEVGRIDSLVHQLLDFAKPAPLNPQEIDIHNLLDDTLSLLNNDFIKHNIKLVKEYQAQNSQLKADSNKLKQAFLNLFLNSIDAMPNGGTLTVSTRNEHQESSIGSSILISVSDTGHGIPDKVLPHIFEPFYSTKEAGTGLGLSIVYNIIKEHNGSVEVESKKNEGSKFVIELLRNENIIRSKK